MSVAVRNILVPLDMSATSDRVAGYATEMSRCFGAKLTALLVVEEGETLRGLNMPTISYDDILPDLEVQARKKLETYAHTRLGGARGLDLRVSHGEAWEKILEAARETGADLIVMGTHGRRGLERAIFGSTAERVLRRSPVPVVAVPLEA